MPPGNGDVYFRVSKDADYGKLSGRKLDDMQAGARIEVEEAQRTPDGLRPVESRQTRRTGLGQPVGQRPPRLAHRVLGHEPGHTRRTDRHPRRRQRPDLPAPRERDRPERVPSPANRSRATGCTTACCSSAARRCPSRSATSSASRSSCPSARRM